MRLSDDQRAMMEGAQGKGAAKAMEILVALGEVFNAPDLLPVRSVQVAGVSYGNLGDEGLDYLEELAVDGRAVVPATLNPAGMDLRAPERMGLDPHFVQKQRRVIAAYGRLGIAAACTCTPYLAGNMPAPGDTLAWSESSAVTYANSVIGARTNREGGPSALAAALTGFTPAYGLHLDAARAPTRRMVVDAHPKGPRDWGLLGMLVGQASDGEVVLVELAAVDGKSGQGLGVESLKAFCAALPTYGGAPMFHLAGVTPEATRYVVPEATQTITSAQLDQAREREAAATGAPELVCLGCPHATLAELRDLAELLRGGQVAVDTWLCTSRPVKALADELGLTETIERSGALVLCDTCFVVAPLKGRYSRLVTNSAKGIYYARGHGGMDVTLLTAAECIEVALTGRMP
jgi:phosphomecalonate degydratase large subunit